ncbi:MAG: 50S ribosomal protein L2 [archaeon]|nr:MAG: 50S ribosomal protein L2 [archaeon]
MGKRIIQQARGKGSSRYRSKKRSFRIGLQYPDLGKTGSAEVLKLINITGYSAPIAKIMFNGKVYYNIAAQNLQEGQKIIIGQGTEGGNIVQLKDLPIGTMVFNIESFPGSNGKLVRTSGIAARIIKKDKNLITVLMPSKREKKMNPKIRVTVGTIAGAGRREKPFVKAGSRYHKMRSVGARVYPRSSAVKMNATDHPFGSGRGKRIKSKIAKRNAPPGAKVGHLRPRKTGKKK